MTQEAIDSRLNVVFETTTGTVHQCDERGVFVVTLFGEQIELKLCGLLSFKRKIFKIDIADLLSPDSSDLSIVYLSQCDRLFAFSTQEILELRDLMEGTMALLHLNSLIHKETIRRPAYFSHS